MKIFKKTETILITIFVCVVFSLLFLFLFNGFTESTVAPLHAIEEYLVVLLGENLRDTLWSLWATQLSLTFVSSFVIEP